MGRHSKTATRSIRHDRAGRRSRVAMGGAALLVLLAVPLTPARGDDAAAADSAEPMILSPSRGRPVFVEPGGRLRLLAGLAQSAGAPRVELVRRVACGRRSDSQTIPLELSADDVAALRAGRPFDAVLPPSLPGGTYDVALRAGGRQAIARHCVAVGPLPPRIRLIHLSNFNVGRVATPHFDAALAAEVNLLAPTLVILTGDMIDAAHPEPANGWREFEEFLDLLDAPALIACGDHDDIGEYSRRIANSPIGLIELGRWHGLVLYDVPGRPVTADGDQLRWLESQLSTRDEQHYRFIVSHDAAPNLLRRWQQSGTLDAWLRNSRLALWFVGAEPVAAGGHLNAALLKAASPLLYISTPPATRAASDDGTPRLRIVDLDRETAFFPGAQPLSDDLPASLRTGETQLEFDAPNDGTRPRIAFTAINHRSAALADLLARVFIRSTNAPRTRPEADEAAAPAAPVAPPSRPWCIGARLEQAIDHNGIWECVVRFDLPDRGALHALVGCDPAPPRPELAGVFQIPAALPWTVTPAAIDSTAGATTPGSRFAVSAVGEAAAACPLVALPSDMEFGSVRIENRGNASLEGTTVVLLDGQSVLHAIVPEQEAPGESTGQEPPATGFRIRMAPGQVFRVRLSSTGLVAHPGRHLLQFYVRGSGAWSPLTTELDIHP